MPLGIKLFFLYLKKYIVTNLDLWTLDRGEAPIESRKAEVSFIYSIIR